MAKTFAEINDKIKKGEAVVVTAQEIIDLVEKDGVEKVAKDVDVVTTGTFGPMCSSGAILNFGHSDPPVKMQEVWLNDVPAYAGLAAVDVYIGATELSKTRGMDYGGGHVIEDLLSGKKICLRAISCGTDCYPRKEITTHITLDSINQAILFNPRNAYQNYCVATNSSNRVLHTYMGILLPHFGNATYSTSGQLSPLINDPLYRTVGIGTRIFLGGGVGYVAFEGTQHNPGAERLDNGVPISPAGTLALIGDLKKMSRNYLRGAVFEKYGVSLFVGVGIPIPILDEEMVKYTSIKNENIYTTIYDYSVEKRSKPTLGRVNYEQLRSGEIKINGKNVPTASMSSYKKALDIAEVLKQWIQEGKFLLQEPIEKLSTTQIFKPLEIIGNTE
ncbi:MAG: homocysteine biosynthesis protein [bacterium]|nr:homocysteine biosynthesis protein [bacterium]